MRTGSERLTLQGDDPDDIFSRKDMSAEEEMTLLKMDIKDLGPRTGTSVVTFTPDNLQVITAQNNGLMQGRSIFNRPDARISPKFQRNGSQAAEVSQKLSDEGSSSPFWARLFLGILRLADIVFADAVKREEFHKITELLINELLNIRSAAGEINKLWSDHARKISEGEIVRIEESVVHISENIDAELRRHTDSFLNTATRALKNSMQDVATFLV